MPEAKAAKGWYSQGGGEDLGFSCTVFGPRPKQVHQVGCCTNLQPRNSTKSEQSLQNSGVGSRGRVFSI